MADAGLESIQKLSQTPLNGKEFLAHLNDKDQGAYEILILETTKR